MTIDWAVDDAFADIPRWNPGVARVLCAPLRRFKKMRSIKDLSAIWSSISDLRQERYDAVLDLHGVYKSAIISFLTRSKRRFGYSSVNLGERGARSCTHRFAPGNGPTPGTAWAHVGETFGYAIEAVPRPCFRFRSPRRPSRTR